MRAATGSGVRQGRAGRRQQAARAAERCLRVGEAREPAIGVVLGVDVDLDAGGLQLADHRVQVGHTKVDQDLPGPPKCSESAGMAVNTVGPGCCHQEQLS